MPTRRPLMDHVQTVVTVELLDRVVAHVTCATEHLPWRRCESRCEGQSV